MGDLITARTGDKMRCPACAKLLVVRKHMNGVVRMLANHRATTSEELELLRNPIKKKPISVHGGLRRGSGRKPSAQRKYNYSAYLNQDTYQRLCEIAGQLNVPKSRAAEVILRMGFKAFDEDQKSLIKSAKRAGHFSKLSPTNTPRHWSEDWMKKF